MEGNIYNKIYDEIKINLPDINFDSDSDSDDLEKKEPIKPYIRPAAEILFGWDDQESEELLEILSKMPSDSLVENTVKHTSNHEIMLNNNNSKIITEKIPFKNISLSNGIRNHIPDVMSDDQSHIILPNFGIHNNLDLDKVLDDMDLSNCESSFFENVLTNIEVIEDNCNTSETSSTLLTRLDEMSKVYEENRQNTNNNNVNMLNISTRISLSNLFNQLKYESSSETIVLDLRTQNSLWETQIDQRTKQSFINQINDVIAEEESSDEENEVNVDKSGPNEELWIDSYRKYKVSMKTKLNQMIEDEEHSKVHQKIYDNKSEIKKDEDKCAHREQEREQNVSIIEDNTISRDINIKIEKIKQREKVLSDRRMASMRIGRLLPVSEDCPLLFHEETSFESLTFSLLPSIESDNEKYLYFTTNVTISSPSSVMTMSKIPSPINDNNPNENFAAILFTLIQFSKVSTTESLFTVIGLQQIYYQNKVQLSLLCNTAVSLTKLKSELKKINLRDVLKQNNISSQLISDLPLSNILQILPYNPMLDGNIWNWNNCSIIWKQLNNSSAVYNDNKRCRPLHINISCVVLEEDFYLSKDFYQLSLKLLEKCVFSGIRLIYHSDGKKQLVLAIRGYDAVNTVKYIQNKSLYRTHVVCTRFEENSLRELVKYFGPRLDHNKITMMLYDNHDRNLANDLSEGHSLFNSLHYNSASDVILLISPVCLDIGWIINTLWVNSGYLLVNMARIYLTISCARQLGINEQLIDDFESTNGICHLIIIRNENPMHVIKSALLKCGEIIQKNNVPNFDRIFYSVPYSHALLSLLNLQRIYQTPSIRELAVSIIECPYEDCEQCSFVLLISDELTRHLAQLLDQMSNLDLLAVKCMYTWPSDEHLALIQTQFKLRLPKINVNRIFEESEGKMRIAIIVVRSMFLIKELEKIQTTMRMENNLIFAYTMNVTTTFEMVGSFFTSSELISDNRRRSLLRFLPEDINSKLSSLSILAQFPLIYSSITTVLSMTISKPSILMTKCRQLWFLLTREGFEVTNVYLTANGTLIFIVKRPNAIYYLVQWTKSHFNNDKSIKITSSTEEIEEFFSTSLLNKEIRKIKSLYYCEDMVNSAFIMMDESLLDSSPEMFASSSIFWTFLEEKKYNCIGLSLKDIEGSDIFKLKDVHLRNLIGIQIKKEARYLCLLLTGSMISNVFEDLFKSKVDLIQEILLENIYLCCDDSQIIDCCNIILKGDIFKNADIDISYEL